ncbi:PREDICTED: uncharacterized protein LOC104761631 isoform X2 [Camelina sativa]|uniref:Uncharacterized protein LOC104761631 isoform X2 n=1 Tax=Camelina sativa TaxID=90675 RepID=A0ABM0XAG0_CAMSA|nr:PREDICTED: uncharacterized protein LOC104761631 isoform X2 [Camelina sativa]
MFSVKENPRGKPENVKIENLFVQIFERKRRIVDQVKQQVDLYDHHLASKCLLAGVSPPSWLWSPSLPSQTSELNKGEIISELLFPSSRPSIICPFSYQRPVRFLADNVVRQDLTSVVNNNPIEEQLLEKEPQHDLSHNLVRHVTNHSHEQDGNIASPRDVHEKEGLPESVSIDCGENQSCSSPEHSQNQTVETNLDATFPGCSQGEKVLKSVSTTGCERKPSPPGYRQEETDPDAYLDPGLSLAKMQRSRSRQKALELRSSAKASKSRSKSRSDLKSSQDGNIGFGIASLRSDSVSEIKLFKHDENDEECRDEVENSNSQDKGGDQCIKTCLTRESFTLHQKVDSVKKSSSEDAYASSVSESLPESGHVNDIDILQCNEKVNEVSAEVDEQVDDPKSRTCNETAYLDGSTDQMDDPKSRTCNETAYLDGSTDQMDDPKSRTCNETAYLDGSTDQMDDPKSRTCNETAYLDGSTDQMDDPKSRTCNETAYLDGSTDQMDDPKSRTCNETAYLDGSTDQMDDPKSRTCNETAYLDGSTDQMDDPKSRTCNETAYLDGSTDQMDDPKSRTCNETAYLDGSTDQMDDPKSRTCNETAYLDGSTDQMDDPKSRTCNETAYLDGSTDQMDDPKSRTCNETAYLDGSTDQMDDPKSRTCNETAYLDGSTDQMDDPKSRTCNETAYLDGSTDQMDDPKSRTCNETAYLDGSTRSKSSSQDSAKEKHQKSSKSFSDAGTSIFQSEIIARSRSNAREDRSKTEHSGSLSSAIDVEPRDSISILQGSHVKDSLDPSTVDVESLIVENITSNDQSEEKGECVDMNRCSSAERVSQTGISPDETFCAGAIQGSMSKTELLGFFESPSVELQSVNSVIHSDDESVSLKPIAVIGEGSLVEEDNNGVSIEISSISNSRSSNQTDITVVEPLQVESILQESGTPEKLIDHSKRCDISCGSKEVQPLGSVTNAGSSQCHERISRPRSSATEENSANEYKAFSVGSYHKSADKLVEVREGNSSLRTPNRPAFVKPESTHIDDNEKRNFDEVPVNSQEKSMMEKVPTPAPAAKVSYVPSLTDFGVNLLADSEMDDIEEHNGLKIEMVQEMESHASHSGLKVGEDEPAESNTFTGHIDASRKRAQHETSYEKGVPPITGDGKCTETEDSHDPESSIQEFFCSSSSIGGSMRQNKRRRTLEKTTSRGLSPSPGGDNLELDSVRETVHHREEVACHNLDNYDVELQKMIGSASSDHYGVELQKMIGYASSAELRFDESYLFKEAGLMSPASFSFRPEQLSVQRSQIAPDHGVRSENIHFLPFAGKTSHGLASCIVRDSDGSPCIPPLGLISSDDGSPPVLEGFLIQTDDENQSGSKNQLNHDNFQLPRTTAESAAMIEQICKSACRTTPSLHLAKTFKYDGKLELDQSVSTELFDGMFFSQNLEGSSVFDNLGINHDYTGRSYTDSLPLSGAGSSAEARNPCTSPTEKLWYRSLQKSSSSEKRSSQTPDLPCISEENENVEEEAENLCTNTPKSTRSEKQRSSILELPCIAEENENMEEISEAVNEASGSERENVSAEMKPLGDVNEEDPMKFLPLVSEAKILVDRQSLDSVNTAFSFSAKCNSVKSKVGKQSNRRFTGKGKENQSGAGAKRNVKPPSSRISKPKLSCNSSLATVGPRLPENEPRHNNIVSNMTSFVPLVQQQKPAPALITGKRDVKVKALEAAEASKRIAEQKEKDRKLKKEAMKLERARQEQENMRKQEIEKKKKEDDRKKKEAEMAWKQEMEKKKKEEERKRKEFEMADRKRQREVEDKKVKEAKRQRIAEIQRQQREADEKLQAEKELKRQAMDARIKAQKELKEDQNNAEKTRGQANTRIPEVRSKSNSSDKVISNPGKMSEEPYLGIEEMEESYDISPYKCSDNEEEEEDDNDAMSNKKFVPTWASKSNVMLAVIPQQNLDPKITFPVKRKCDISEVLLPPRFQSR